MLSNRILYMWLPTRYDHDTFDFIEGAGDFKSNQICYSCIQIEGEVEINQPNE